MKFHVVTLGCDKNTVDSERYISELVAYGAESVGDAAEAELIVVNTCGFIDAAKAESIDAILEAARHKVTGACRVVAAVGCMVERHRDELSESIPEVDLLLGTSETDRLVTEVAERGLLGSAPALEHPGVRLYAGSTPHIRYLKISEGCDHGCAFCAIPLMRGKHRSFTTDDLVREAQLLELQGAREVNLVAQDLAHYGRDIRDGRGLPDLLESLLAGTDIPWFRLLYIYSAGLTDRVLQLMNTERRIVRYLDIPMQHGADTVLARMRRPERKRKQLATIAHLRDMVPDVTLRSTVIVGFPGETEAEFQELLDFLEEVQLDRLGVFTYSPQSGTRAFEMTDDVPDEVKRDRMERIQELQRLITEERYENLLGRTVRAIIDHPADGEGPAQARLESQADDIDGVTWLQSAAAPGTIVDVLLEEVVDSFDFRARQLSVRDVPRAPTSRPSRRNLPIAGTSVGSFGRRA
jgi:ribosomal protein S12 methylthiotransferase